jgi:hypothetical protein
MYFGGSIASSVKPMGPCLESWKLTSLGTLPSTSNGWIPSYG